MFLTFVTFLPLLGAIGIAFLPEKNESLIKQTALGVAIADFLLSLAFYFNFDLTTPNMQFELSAVWIENWGVNFHVGLDGISLLLYIMTTFLTAICIISVWTVKKRIKEYMMALLVLSTGMLGVFVALDLFMFYVFWELQLVPMYLIIGIWGGARRLYASIKFFLYTAFGSLLMLVAIIWMYQLHAEQTGIYTTDLMTITNNIDIPFGPQKWLFVAFFLAFAIKVPMFPFHTWLPDAHVEAPTAGSVILAGVLLKMGTYGFLRFNLPLFPYACNEFMPYVGWLAVVGIVYGAFVSMVQEDLKKLVAYSSVSHMGFVMLGIFAFNQYGIQGALVQNLNHGISTSALFLLVGVIYDRRHTRMIKEFGGITNVMPKYAIIFMIVALSSIGLPGMNGFVGEFLILLGIFQADAFMAGVATTGVIFAACYILWMFQRVMFLKSNSPENAKLKDLDFREYAMLLPLVVLIFWIGIYPKPFMKTFDASVTHLISKVDPSNFKPKKHTEHADSGHAGKIEHKTEHKTEHKKESHSNAH